MSDRKYDTYKFYYDDDLGRTIIKSHRSYLNSDGVTEDTPTTRLFRDRVIDSDLKVTGTSKGLRHVWSYVNTGGSGEPRRSEGTSARSSVQRRQLMAKIPYAPGNPLLIDHINEILAQPQVECGDYRGETLLTGGSTNGI